MNKIKILLMAMICIAATSCLKEKREATYNAQESKIDQYITNNMYVKYSEGGESKTDTLRVVYRGGSSRLVTTEGAGEELKENGTVTFYYAGYSFSGSKSYTNMFATNRQESAKAAKWELTDPDYELYTIDMGDTDIIEGLRQGLIGVKSSEVCQILFSGKYAFGKKPLGIVPANSALLYEIWIEGISNE